MMRTTLYCRPARIVGRGVQEYTRCCNCSRSGGPSQTRSCSAKMSKLVSYLLLCNWTRPTSQRGQTRHRRNWT
eukprot:3777316-Rhodomonas_salina.1